MFCLMVEHKIIFTGSMGFCRSSAVAVVADGDALSTALIKWDNAVDKAVSEVVFDYSEIALGEGEYLKFYGTCEQDRFSFMWQVFSIGALGVIIVVDDSVADPFQKLAIYVENFRQLIARNACVVCVSNLACNNTRRLDEFAGFLASMGVVCPVVASDVVERQEVLFVLELLLMQLYV